jgi:hypothetical protein
MVSGRHHRYRRHDNANEQTEWQLPMLQKVVANNARQGMTFAIS